MLMFACSGLFIIALMAAGSYMAYRHSLIDVIGTNRSDVLSQIGNRVRDFKSNAYTISNLYYYDDNFNNYAQSLNDGNVNDFSNYMDDLTRQYKVSFNKVNLDYYVVYLSKDGYGYCSDDVPADYDYMNPEIRIWYKDLYAKKGEITDVACYKDKALGRNSFVAARTVIDSAGNIVGYLMININEQQIFHTYEDVISPESNIYVVNSNGDIISSNISKIAGFHYFNMHNLKTMFGDKVYAIVEMPKYQSLLSKFEDPEYEFTVFEETPLDYLLMPIRHTRNMVIFISCLVTLVGAILAWIFSGKITGPIRQLRDYVLRVEGGDLDAEIHIHSYSEINTLGNGIQQMLARIRELIESVKRKEEQKRKMQYNVLQAQINPHFMYNTLFSIKCVVDMNENERGSKMLSSFIQLLRSMLADPDTLITISQQMDSLRQYAELQKFRYGDSLEIVIEYDDKIADCLLPQLLIQPLVENAIVHGGLGSGSGCSVIAVSARLKKGKIVIEVEDSGAGMTAQQADAVIKGEYKVNKNHIGIKNIDERIKLFFGEEYGLRIESFPGEGTKILINIPAIRQKG